MAEKAKTIEREYIIPLRRRYKHVARYKKTPKAIRTIKEFLVRHMTIRDRDLDKVKIDKYLNEFVWGRGIKNPPSKIKVKATKEGDIVRVELVNYPDSIKFKKARAERQTSEHKEKVAKKKVEQKTEEQKTAEVEKKESVIETGIKENKEKHKEEKHETKMQTKDSEKKPFRQALKK